MTDEYGEIERMQRTVVLYRAALDKLRKQTKRCYRYLGNLRDRAKPDTLTMARVDFNNVCNALRDMVTILMEPEGDGFDASKEETRDFRSSGLIDMSRFPAIHRVVGRSKPYFRGHEQSAQKSKIDSFMAEIANAGANGVSTKEVVEELKLHGWDSRRYAKAMAGLLGEVFEHSEKYGGSGGRPPTLAQKEKVIRLALELVRQLDPKVELHAHAYDKISNMPTEELELIVKKAVEE